MGNTGLPRVNIRISEVGKAVLDWSTIEAPSGSANDDDTLPLILSHYDLVPDERGEVVLFNDAGLQTLTISSSAEKVAAGKIGGYVTRSEQDVSGFCFLAFDNGMTIYYPNDLRIQLVNEQFQRTDGINSSPSSFADSSSRLRKNDLNRTNGRVRRPVWLGKAQETRGDREG